MGKFKQIESYASAEQCAAWTNSIFRRQSFWRQYQQNLWTLGNAWYLDIERGELNYYHAMAQSSNALVSELDGFVETMTASARLLAAPGKKVNLPVRSRGQNLGPYWCDAGVHILGGSEGKFRVGGVHADYEGLAPYPEMLFDPETRAYSCILSIATPSGGGGLEVWPGKRHLGNELFIDHLFKKKDAVKLKYKTGTLTIIDSFLYHSLADCTFGNKGLWRIAGVIHFLYRKKPYPHWEYWF